MCAMHCQEFKLFRTLVACLCIFSLVGPNLIWAVVNDGYHGTTTAGRPSIAIVNAPGGTRFNTFTGNLFLSRTQLLIPGRGLLIEVRLTYNSDHHRRPSAFGFGWNFNYDVVCHRHTNGNLVVEWGDGRMDLFRLKNGSFTAANEGVADTLQEVGSAIRVTNPQHIQFVFDATSCLLQRIHDPNGNALTFAYNAGLLFASATDDAGRQLSA